MSMDREILATLAYHDVFDYPLKENEITKYLIDVRSQPQKIKSEILKLQKKRKVSQFDDYFYLNFKNRLKIVNLRKLRTKYSNTKFKKAYFYGKILKIIPQIKLVALTGALAMGNSHKFDDIDLLIVTAKNRLWTTRFFSNFALWPWKRKPSSKKVSNKACLNIFIDESDLRIKEKNLYTAHEICQMKLLWDRENAYMRFINANNWVKKYLPNWQPDVKRPTTNDKRKSQKRAVGLSRLALLKPLEAFMILVALRAEWIAKWGQLWYMQRKITKESIGKTQLFFHPQDQASWILSEYAKRIKKFNIRA